MELCFVLGERLQKLRVAYRLIAFAIWFFGTLAGIAVANQTIQVELLRSIAVLAGVVSLLAFLLAFSAAFPSPPLERNVPPAEDNLSGVMFIFTTMLIMYIVGAALSRAPGTRRKP